MAMTGSRTLKVAQYCLMPQILPRLAELLFSGFGFFAFFIAQVFRGVRLLPEGHPYLNAAETGNFTIMDVIMTARRGLKHSKENIDQVIIFYVILLGLLLMGLQVFMLLIGLFAPQAMAFSLTDYFGNAHLTVGNDPYQDLAFILLDRVFGVPGIFDSCVSMAAPCYMAAPDDTWNTAETVYTPASFPWPFHLALQAMFAFYSTGLLVIACMILLYFVVVIVAETAQTGVPFGKRFNKVWAPIRLVVALGLLIPISNGLNSAQYIVLYAAKLGSNFATNGWIQFNSQLSTGMMFDEQMVAYPQAPSIGDLLQFMMLAHSCKALQEGYIQQNPDPNFTARPSSDCAIANDDQENDAVINAYLVKSTGDASTDAVPLETTDYSNARTFFGNGDMSIRIGDRGCSKRHDVSMGHTVPTCGELVLTSPTQISNSSGGAYKIQEGYYELIRYLWGEYMSGSQTNIWDRNGYCNASISGGTVMGYTTSDYNTMTSGAGDQDMRKKALYFAQQLCPVNPDKSNPSTTVDTSIQDEPTNDWVAGTYSNYMYGQMDAYAPSYVSANASYSPNGTAGAIVTNIIRAGVISEQNLVTSGGYGIPIDLIDRGWAGAGLWYNHIAQANGAVTGAAQATPKIVHFPELMEVVAMAKMRNNKNVALDSLYSPTKGEDSDLQLRKAGEAQAAVALQQIYEVWRNVGPQFKPATGNMVYSYLNALFGTQGLFDLRDPGNQNVHPLALLTSMGKSLLEAAVRNLGLSVVGSIVEPMGGAAGGLSGIGKAILSFATSITLGAGIILYYVLPFMPFLYFFFAVGNWVKSVFEAMVGVPLWAMAHIRIDGDGLPGSSALSGYMMIFEIFLRPIMIVFGLLAAVSVFAAMAITLNAIFDIAVINAGGTNFQDKAEMTFMEFARGPIDQLFYTVMYAVIMYIIAMSSFKMIDLIPNQIMRWMGQSVQSFAGMQADSAAGLMSNIQTQGLGKVQQVTGGLQNIGGLIGKGASSSMPKSDG